MFYDRQTKQLIEHVEYKQKTLHFLYNTTCGRILLKLFIARPWLSRLYGLYQKSKLSQKDILPFAKKYNIQIDEEYIQAKYMCFNDFFIRHKTINTEYNSANFLISPADSKLNIYHIDSELSFAIKNSIYNIEDLLQDKNLANDFKGGYCLVFRLCVDDYHRYHFIDDGRLISHKHIKGELHTVRPISEKYNVYTRNTREISILDTNNLGRVVYVEVGALLVGKIHNHEKQNFKRFEEKGYFEFGGSTIVLLLNKNIKFDSDIIEANNLGYEVKVCTGEPIGQIEE